MKSAAPWANEPLQNSMYRYSQKRYSKLLLTLGCIRIGTLHDFRRLEHKRGIADPQEGKKEVFHHIDHLFVADSNDPPLHESKDMRALEQFRAVKMENSRDITFKNLTVARKFDHEDCFILCSSRTLSKRTMAQFEGADSCVQITDTSRFYQLLTNVLNSITPVIFRGAHDVIYQDRKEPWNGLDWGHHPALIKETKFREQEEIREIWQPRFGGAIQPVVTGHYRLGALCTEALP